jgi:hypothetical protein
MLKKKIIILSILITTGILLTVSYRSYGIKKANEYARRLTTLAPVFTAEGDAHVEKIIRQTPANLVILIKWGDNKEAYISVMNWMTGVNDSIDVDVVDESKSLQVPHIYD